MVKRKAIAVVAADVFNEYINKIMCGLSEQANALGYDVHVFMMTFNNDAETLLQKGEENIYTLMNSDVISGAVFICGNIRSRKLIEKLEKKLVEMDMPVVSIDSKSNICECLNAEDEGLFEMITDHFIEVHNCRKIMCLTGIEGFPQSESRLSGYKKSMEKHGIPVTDDLVVYGDFWTNTAHQLADEFKSGKRSIPEAVVCANDMMAISLCNYLISMGYNVPEDIMISGYDGSPEANENIPSVTTIFPLNHDLGAKAVRYLHKKITGEEGEAIPSQKGSIIHAQSCGCGVDKVRCVQTHENYSSNIKHFDTLYRSSGMTEQLLEVKSLDELMNKIDNFMYLINGLNVYMLCLCDNWDDVEHETNEFYLREGYSENMTIKMIRSGDRADITDYVFKSSEIIPQKMNEYVAEPSTFFYLPMHFQDRCFGYSIFNFNDVRRSLSTLYAMWCRNINMSLEFLRVRTKLMFMNQRISLNSIRDTLTGIYNRKGFKRFSEMLFKKSKTENKKILILVADLDMLKYINDNFGHIEGDNAITVCATVLNTCCQNSEICARIGGDEYAIVGCYDYTDEIIDGYIGYIRDYFERYNSSSGKPYPVDASVGYYCGIPDEDMDFQDCFGIADKKMYENKFERKKFRNS